MYDSYSILAMQRSQCQNFWHCLGTFFSLGTFIMPCTIIKTFVKYLCMIAIVFQQCSCKGNTQKLCHSTKLCFASRIQLHWFVHASPLPVCRTLRTLLFMVPLLFIIIVSCHFACPHAFLYMYLHQHGIPILSSSDPLLGALIT